MVYLAVTIEYLGQTRSYRVDALFSKVLWDLTLGKGTGSIPGRWHRVAVFGVFEGLRRGELQQSRVGWGYNLS